MALMGGCEKNECAKASTASIVQSTAFDAYAREGEYMNGQVDHITFV